MSEYILFDLPLCQRFVKILGGYGLKVEVRPDRIEGFVVTLPDDLPDGTELAVEGEYDALMVEQASMIESSGDSGERTLMRVTATLKDGSECIVQLPGFHARRLFAHFTIEEIHDLVSAIAQSAMCPVEGPMCRKEACSTPPRKADDLKTV